MGDIALNYKETPIVLNNVVENIKQWDTLFDKLINKDTIPSMELYIQEISMNYNIDKKNIIKDFLNYIIRSKPAVITSDSLNFIENIMHFQDCKNSHYIYYTLLRLSSFISKDS
jgi:hypothetical protein